MYCQCTLLGLLVGACSAVFNEFLSESFQVFSHDLGKSLTEQRNQLCRKFLKFFFAQGDELKKGVAGLCILTGGFEKAAVVAAKKTDSPD